MNTDFYGFNQINLALDGTLEQFYELYQNVYNSYLDYIRIAGLNTENRGYCEHQIVLKEIGKFENLAFRRRRIFTKEKHSMRLERSDFKYFSFFDEERIKDFKRHAEFYSDPKHANLFEEERLRYCGEDNAVFFFEKTAIDFDQFLILFQNIVTRAIWRIKKTEQPDLDIFDVRKEVLRNIEERMKRRRECSAPSPLQPLLPHRRHCTYSTF